MEIYLMVFRELLIAVDKSTQRIVWKTPYREWPRMMPSDPNLAIFPWRGYTEVQLKDMDDLRVIHDRADIRILDQEIPKPEKERLLLLREKCMLCWRWLIQLHDLQKSVQGFLPFMPLGKEGTQDRKLFYEEQSRVSKIIAEEITDNHDRIWLAMDMDELSEIAEHLASKRHHNRQPYY